MTRTSAPVSILNGIWWLSIDVCIFSHADGWFLCAEKTNRPALFSLSQLLAFLTYTHWWAFEHSWYTTSLSGHCWCSWTHILWLENELDLWFLPSSCVLCTVSTLSSHIHLWQQTAVTWQIPSHPALARVKSGSIWSFSAKAAPCNPTTLLSLIISLWSTPYPQCSRRYTALWCNLQAPPPWFSQIWHYEILSHFFLSLNDISMMTKCLLHHLQGVN